MRRKQNRLSTKNFYRYNNFRDCKKRREDNTSIIKDFRNTIYCDKKRSCSNNKKSYSNNKEFYSSNDCLANEMTIANFRPLDTRVNELL